ncbi:alpha/beta hydrolase [Actinosynnema sp. ALI-1.44]|uniref:alpha/beta fold hydrolase n=1 Tax=Actinosynnema sp. ALI-1.44 TaxID=1933779 RepID=UPI00097C26C9|nr:alpha/beta hydrolase [Actinosynnema sp. ALI-1.44]ONI78726.1 alpha/beta hydrolase [Actinosynnema sp. ALI-1.44]
MGIRKVARLSRATVDYRECGEGSPVVFVHGLLVNSNLWRKVAPLVAEAGNRCIAPDWPLGGHTRPVPGADLTPPGVADLIAEFLNNLDLRDVTLVANDTGGALVQLVLARNPVRVGRAVFTPSDCFEHFLPQPFTSLPKLARVPGFGWALANVLRSRVIQRSPVGFGLLTKRPVPQDVVDSYLLPSRTSPAVRADLTRFVRTIHNRHTLDAARKIGSFAKPVLLAWAKEDRIFPVELAHRLAGILPNATVTEIPDTLTLVPEDRPDELAELIVKFVRAN